MNKISRTATLALCLVFCMGLSPLAHASPLSANNSYVGGSDGDTATVEGMREQQSDQAGTAGQQSSYVGESSAPGRVSRPPVEEVWASASDPERGCSIMYNEDTRGIPCGTATAACVAAGIIYSDGSRPVVGHRVKTSTGQRADDWKSSPAYSPALVAPVAWRPRLSW